MADYKETTFTFRVDADLKAAFTQTAKAQDRSASLLLRDYMRDYVRQHGQTELFDRKKT